MSFLLDTNHCIYLINGRNKKPEKQSELEKNTLSHFDIVTDPLFLSEVTLGEMYFGAAKSQQKTKNYSRVEALRTSFNILPVTLALWKLFGETKASLQKQGKIIADLDLLIACSAIHHDLTLVTNDRAFDLLTPVLKTVNWSAINPII
jgi:tRNA(fMet)-specific endonuclease VapC